MTDISKSPQSSEDAHVRKSKNWFVRAIVLVLVALVLLFVLFPLFVRDSKTVLLPDTANEALGAVPPLPEGSNGYDYFTAAGAVLPTKFSEFHQKILNGEAWEDEAAEAILAFSDRSLAEFIRGVNCSYVLCPEVKSIDDELPYIPEWVTLAKLCVVQARLLFNKREEASAFDKLLQVLRFGQMVADNSNVLITYLVGQSIKGRALDAMKLLIPESTLDEHGLMVLAEALESCKADNGGLKHALSGEYRGLCGTIDDIAAGRVDLGGIMLDQWYYQLMLMFSYKPNTTKQMLTDAFKVYYESADKSNWDVDFKAFPKASEESGIKLYLSGNAFGKTLYSMVMPAYDKVFASRTRIEAKISAIQVLYAMKAAFNKSGKLPTTLDELSYPDRITPIDAFTGKAFVYAPARAIFYSLGEDKIDNSGSDEDDVFHLAFYSDEVD